MIVYIVVLVKYSVQKRAGVTPTSGLFVRTGRRVPLPLRLLLAIHARITTHAFIMLNTHTYTRLKCSAAAIVVPMAHEARDSPS